MPGDRKFDIEHAVALRFDFVPALAAEQQLAKVFVLLGVCRIDAAQKAGHLPVLFLVLCSALVSPCFPLGALIGKLIFTALAVVKACLISAGFWFEHAISAVHPG